MEGGSSPIITNARKQLERFKAQTTTFNIVQIGAADVKISHMSKVSN